MSNHEQEIPTIERLHKPVIITSSPSKIEYAERAGIKHAAASGVVAGIGRRESRSQDRFKRERQIENAPESVFDDTYDHPFDRLLAVIAYSAKQPSGFARVDDLREVNDELLRNSAMSANNDIEEAQVELEDHIGSLGLYTVDTGFSVVRLTYDPSSKVHIGTEKEVYSKVGPLRNKINEFAQYLHEKAFTNDPNTIVRLRSESGIAIRFGNLGEVYYSTLDLGRPNPKRRKNELIRMMKQHPNSSGGMTTPELIKNEFVLFDDYSRFTLRKIGEFNHKWSPLDETEIVEEITGSDLYNVLNDMDVAHSLAHGLTPALVDSFDSYLLGKIRT